MDAVLRLVSDGVNADRKRIGSGSSTGNSVAQFLRAVSTRPHSLRFVYR